MSAASPPPPSAAGPPNGNGAMYGQEYGGRSSNRSSYGAPLEGQRHIDDLNAEALGRARDMSNLPVSIDMDVSCEVRD
jgi:hypothetical protein